MKYTVMLIAMLGCADDGEGPVLGPRTDYGRDAGCTETHVYTIDNHGNVVGEGETCLYDDAGER